MKLARWLLPLLSLGIVLLLTLRSTEGRRLGPGPLHPAHAGVAELADGANCEACHRKGQGIAQDGCTRCHEPIAAQLATERGLHGSLPAAQRQRCEQCHSEHHGAGAPLIAGHAFALAGYPAGTPYDHRHVAFRLTGAHDGVACAKCHIGADAAAPPAGGRFLGITQACTECHDDVHKTAFGRDCESCHGQQQPWREAPGFAHATFPLRDSHRKVACAECHATGTAHDVAALQQQSLPARTCVECHADPHRSEAPKALQLAGTADCARCHDASSWGAAKPTAAQHEAFGFALRSAHATADCAGCHGSATVAPRWTGLPPTVAACAVCHRETPHAAAVVATATAAVGPADGCADCHRDADASFRGATMAPLQHAATGFPLSVPHAAVECAQCHTGDAWAQRFPGRTAAACRACHADVHRGQFDHEPRYAQCTACHEPTQPQFLPHGFGVGDHAATAFPLTGAHDAVACSGCHRDTVDGARTFRGTASRCAACHEDVHAGRFDRKGLPATVAGREGCARCHDTAAFAPVAAAFDHARWTGHALRSAHATLACAACHPAGGGGPGTANLGKAAGTTCAACHQDPHAGQFRVGAATDCARCHGEQRWSELHFDHQRDSRFPLDGQHLDVACARCHAAYATPRGPVVRYKPLGTTCGDCHRLGAGGEVLK
ncbi:MAG: cytochrome c3 family protein [Planctomycetes bacterium]|nr:cytochrome c3 family protein [Planctomycetota bacterium]